ncbi:MAG: hypothetical protein IPJ79_11890 [Bacteroidetes bacterium]|nr:hypothetical protein [Bacteroidota bacterium]
MDGFDSDWIPSSSLNTASYTNLDGGSYIFKIKAAGSNSTERILNIEVANIFYKTWWFRILVFTALLFTIYRFLKFREKQRSRKESERTIDYFLILSMEKIQLRKFYGMFVVTAFLD